MSLRTIRYDAIALKTRIARGTNTFPSVLLPNNNKSLSLCDGRGETLSARGTHEHTFVTPGLTVTYS